MIAHLKLLVLGVLLLVSGSVTSGLSAQQVPTSQAQIQMSFAPVVRAAGPAVVNVYSTRVVRQRRTSPFLNDPFFQRFFGDEGFGIPRKRVENSLGSGVIVSDEGFVVTNHHVIKGGTEIRVVLSDRREFEAKVVLKDERTDLAVLKINSEGERLPFLRLRDSDELMVGDLVLAIGNPFGVGQTVTSGIVSALARSRVGVSDYQSFIQTDAAINPGNSGGALIDINGRLIGINTAIFSRSGGSNGIGFAVPANMVEVVIEAAKGGTTVKRPWFGASLQAVTQGIADSLGFDRPRGALLKAVHPKGPAYDAGLKRGDVVISVDGRPINEPQDFHYRLATKKLGRAVKLTYLRGGRKNTTKVELVSAPEDPPMNQRKLSGRQPFAGAIVANLSPALNEKLRREADDSGVIILKVGRGPARRVGFRAGDVILEVDGAQIETVRDLVKTVRDERPRWTIVFRRDGRVLETTVRG